MEWSIGMKSKGCESIRSYTHFVHVFIDFNHDHDFGF